MQTTEQLIKEYIGLDYIINVTEKYTTENINRYVQIEQELQSRNVDTNDLFYAEKTKGE